MSLPQDKVFPHSSQTHLVPGRPSVLISSRDEESRTMWRTILSQWNFDVIESCGCAGSIAEAGSEVPVAALVDGGLPFSESLSAVETIRSFPSLKEIPVLLMSAFTDAGYRAAAIDSGATSMLVKPVDFEELQAYLSRLTRESSGLMTEVQSD